MIGVTLIQVGGIESFTDRVLWVWGILEGALGLLYVVHRTRGPGVMPHLKEGQWEEGEDEGALTSVVKLSYKH